MSEGFSEEKIEVSIYKDEVKNLLKKYKNIKKYQKSSIFEIKTMDGAETYISQLIKEAEENPQQMGKHYLLNLYGCSFVLLDDERCLIDLLENAAVASGATVIQTISKKFEPQGVTVICLLSESHISIHTWPEEGKAAVDVYTCGDCNPKIGCDIIIQQLYATNHTLSYIER